MDQDFKFQGKSKRSYENSSKIVFLVGVFGVTSLLAFGIWALIEFITKTIA